MSRLLSVTRRLLTKNASNGSVEEASEFLNKVARSMYFPGLPEGVNVASIAFYRRRPKGFTNGHYIMLNGATLRKPAYAAFAGYFTAISFLVGVACMHQYDVWFNKEHVPM